MSVTIVSVYLKTESGDGYLFTYDRVESVEEFVELVEKDLGDELAYVYSVDINVMYSRTETREYEDALQERIAEMGDDE
ncbi:hypothetical protein QGX12_gp037 [Pseudomonas phage Kremar]|uniref:Uncharacterized protein n=1 Tax=Pseudomonas phage Kremar TaxID=2928831 RepID=A0AAE9GPJ1_9CAUD|nr:hypothetical protein QGX12_gp037 [Pseudomonas phage Kremar]UOL48460.1 hypothetical protein [Pseudomonas phage Kremar]